MSERDEEQVDKGLRRSVLWAAVLVALVAAAALLYHLLGGAGRLTGDYIVDQRPELLTYPELVTLSDTPRDELEPTLRRRLDDLLTTPFVNNEAYYDGARPHRPVEAGLGPTLRVVSWNIERGLKLDLIRSALAGGDDFLENIDPDDDDLDIDAQKRREIERELHLLQTADVLVLQELDWGVKRTEYRAVVEELARATRMNWAYGVEFLEVDPFMLGIEKFPGADEDDRAELQRRSAVDEQRYKGLHGTAVLSRYPIANARLLPLKHQGYDWFSGERDSVSTIEEVKRDATEGVFHTTITREIRRGGRTLLLVDIDVDSVPEGRLSIAAAHLESRTGPSERQAQLKEVLGYLHDIRNPVVLAGDMNTSGEDGTPTSWKREIYQRVGDEEFWARTALKYFSGVGIAFDAVVAGVGVARRANDPTVEDIPVLSPNEAEGFFDLLENFRFADGYAFDFRGDEEHSVNGNEGTLANSNHRDAKGFAVTFEVERTVGPAGKMKLDWIFVKAYATDPRDESASYRFAPNRGRTMEEINYCVDGRMSDHSPISVDLPLPQSERES
ncbi:MAG: endonuclease/exonuclease/phosphatase family protein [Acidobacteriota bacterium]|jgi:endonuclease/exonuclease/phosphatase family metal-dependent hydrolase